MDLTIVISTLIFTIGLTYGLYRIADAIGYAGWISTHQCRDDEPDDEPAD